MEDRANSRVPVALGILCRGEKLEEDRMEFESLISVERRLPFVDLQGLFDLSGPEALLLREDADILHADAVSTDGLAHFARRGGSLYGGF